MSSYLPEISEMNSQYSFYNNNELKSITRKASSLDIDPQSLGQMGLKEGATNKLKSDLENLHFPNRKFFDQFVMTFQFTKDDQFPFIQVHEACQQARQYILALQKDIRKLRNQLDVSQKVSEVSNEAVQRRDKMISFLSRENVRMSEQFHAQKREQQQEIATRVDQKVQDMKQILDKQAKIKELRFQMASNNNSHPANPINRVNTNLRNSEEEIQQPAFNKSLTQLSIAQFITGKGNEERQGSIMAQSSNTSPNSSPLKNQQKAFPFDNQIDLLKNLGVQKSPDSVREDSPGQNERSSIMKDKEAAEVFLNHLLVPKRAETNFQRLVRKVDKRKTFANIKNVNVNNNPNNISRDDRSDVDVNSTIRNNFLLHINEYAFVTSLLDMNMDDAGMVQFFNECKEIVFLNEMINDPVGIQKKIAKGDQLFMEAFVENIRQLQRYFNSFAHIMMKLKRIVGSVIDLNNNHVLDEAFKLIVNETCKMLGCDRASVFLIDQRKKELWSKVAQGAGSIHIPLYSGLAGHVAKTGEILNLLDAHQDMRFNRESDIQSNYRTQTVLCVPIFYDDKVIGVVQAINQQTGDFFTKDDQGILCIFSILAYTIIRNSIFMNERLQLQKTEREMIMTSMRLNSCTTIGQMLIQAQHQLEDNYDYYRARIFLVDEAQGKFYRYNLLMERVDYPMNIGHVSTCYYSDLTYSIIMVENCKEHVNYNSQVDIDTNLPIICVPIFYSCIGFELQAVNTGLDKKQIGVIQCVNQKGLDNVSFRPETDNQILNSVFDHLVQFSRLIAVKCLNFQWIQQNLSIHLNNQYSGTSTEFPPE